jgi:8-oxo-dGTP diphosphatase
MCKRKTDPYKGLSNFVGGQIEPDENREAAGYRELLEETGITNKDIILMHLMDFTYHLSDVYVEVYVGKLNKSLTVQGDENELYWSDLSCNFFDMSLYAGEGNIGHILEQVKICAEKLFVD